MAIDDASVESFREFLQFFYATDVELTMKNIESVLYLAHKYDTADFFQKAIEFLKKNLTHDSMLRALHSALKLHSDDLKTFLDDDIRKHNQAFEDKLHVLRISTYFASR